MGDGCLMMGAGPTGGGWAAALTCAAAWSVDGDEFAPLVG